MKTLRFFLTLLATLPITCARGEDAAATPPGVALMAVLIDDQTGVELAEKHGIQALALEDMDGLLNAVVRGRQSVQLHHIAVDEDASENPVPAMMFRPYVGETPPKAPAANLPVRQMAAEMQRYRKERALWQLGLRTYQAKVKEDLVSFIGKVQTNQLAVSTRFDELLAKRNGQDFNRSDIAGCIESSNRLLQGGKRRVIVLNSDCVDLPGKRPRRTLPLSAAQLDPAVTLIFVNTSRKPEQEPIFRGLKNETHHAETMAAAMKILIGMLGEGGQEPQAAQEPGSE